MLVLFETAAGFAVFKVLDEKKLKNVEALADDFATPESAARCVQLEDFHKFHDSAEALAAAVSINEGHLVKPMKSMLKKLIKKGLYSKLLVLDTKLGASIKEKLPDLKIISNSAVSELIRCIRGQMASLIPGISEKESSAMMLGLGHNLARYKLKFSPDKVDTMVVQAINLLDDLDKELNNYVMRAKEWYGWHFPELAKILTDNTAYINTILLMGKRINARFTDFGDTLSEELAERVKEAAEVSMGCDVSENDIDFMQQLCEQIHSFSEYRNHLHEYLINRMVCLAPNLSILVGEMIGARLISHTGSLINLAKNPASTIQLIGAEKALFRALKTKKNTPKYGLIYHAELVAKSSVKNKGKMSRMLAAKAALGARVDALGDDTDISVGENSRVKLLKSLSFWNSGKATRISGQSKHFAAKPHFQDRREAGHYDERLDSTYGGEKRQRAEDDSAADAMPLSKKRKKETKPLVTEIPENTDEQKPKKKKKRKSEGTSSQEDLTEIKDEEPQENGQLKKKKKKKSEKSIGEVEASEAQEDIKEETGEKKKKKKKKTEQSVCEEVEASGTQEDIKEETGEKKKKKKRKSKDHDKTN